MIKNIRTEVFVRGSRLNFDILCDVCGDNCCVHGEGGKTYCWKHKGKDKRVFVESVVHGAQDGAQVELPKTYEDGILAGRREIIEGIKTMPEETKTLEEARLFSKALGNFLSKLKE